MKTVVVNNAGRLGTAAAAGASEVADLRAQVRRQQRQIETLMKELRKR